MIPRARPFVNRYLPFLIGGTKGHIDIERKLVYNQVNNYWVLSIP